MSERKVSLRVSAVGGDRLKAELRSIGKEGQHALSMLETGGPGASRGLHATGLAATELMERLTHLSVRAAQAANTFRDVERDGLSVLTRVNAATGVSGRTSRQDEDIQAYGRALDDLRARMNPAFAELQRHRDAIAEIDRAWRVGAITLDEWVSATWREEAANANAANAIRQRQAAFENFVNTGLRNAINEITGVSGTLARSEEDMAAFGRAMDDARAKFAPLYAEQRRHGEAMDEMNRLYRAGILSQEEFAAASAREVAAHAEAAGAMRARQAAMQNLVDTTLRNRIDQVTGVSGDAARSAADMEAYGRALDATRAKYNPMFAAIHRYRAELADVRAAHRAGAISADEMSAALSRLRQESLRDIGIIKGRIQGYQAMEKGAGMARFQMVQLGYQLNDIGVSLASGQNPLIVMVQQGAQIAQIYGSGQGGVGAALGQMRQMLGGLVTKFWPVLVAVSAVSAAVAGMTHEINETSKITVTFGDTMKAVFEVIGAAIWEKLKPAVDSIMKFVAPVWQWLVDKTKIVGNAVVNGYRAAFEMLPIIARGVFEAIPLAASAIVPALNARWEQVKSGFYSMLEFLTEKWGQFLSFLGEGLSQVPIPKFQEVAKSLSASGIGTQARASAFGAASSRADAQRAQYLQDAQIALGAGQSRVASAIQDAFARGRAIMQEDPLGGFFDAVKIEAVKNAIERLEKERKKEKGAKKGQTDEVDRLIERLKHELEITATFDPVARRMIELREQMKTATDAEAAAIRTLVEAIEEQKTGWTAVTLKISEYTTTAQRIGGDLAAVFANGFRGAEDAVGRFVETGKLSVRDMVTSMIADMARLASRRFIFGPLSGVLNNVLSGISPAFGAAMAGGAANGGLGAVYDGGGFTGWGARSGGLDGKGGFLAMMHPRESVIDHTKRGGGRAGLGFREPAPVYVTINARDAESFRQSRVQLQGDIARAVALGRGRL